MALKVEEWKDVDGDDGALEIECVGDGRADRSWTVTCRIRDGSRFLLLKSGAGMRLGVSSGSVGGGRRPGGRRRVGSGGVGLDVRIP